MKKATFTVALLLLAAAALASAMSMPYGLRPVGELDATIAFAYSDIRDAVLDYLNEDCIEYEVSAPGSLAKPYGLRDDGELEASIAFSDAAVRRDVKIYLNTELEKDYEEVGVD